MSYRVWFHCSQGKYYITHDCFLGLGDLTNLAKEASLYHEPVTKEDIDKFLLDENFNITVLAWGNEEIL